MAEDSVFWDGISTGHAATTDVWGAPYSSTEFGDVFSKLLGSNAARGFVIPGYGNSLSITANSPAAMSVLANTGALFMRGKLYENTAQQTLTIAVADATNPRLDRIVARITWASQTVTLAVLAGTAAATPALPALTQNATTYEISLAYVWVAAATASIAETEVHDERIFAADFEALLTSLLQGNLIRNSEFMAFSRLSTVPTTVNGRPDNWELVGTVTFAGATKPSQMSRGRAVQITAGAGSSGMSQAFRCEASTVYSIRTLINVTAGDVGVVSVTDNGASPATISRNIRRTGAYIEETVYYTTPSDATIVTVSLLANSNTDVVTIGQTLAAKGYLPGPYRQIHETIFFDHAIGDASWNATAKSSVTTTIDLDSDFQALILPGTRSLWLYLLANDSGSAGGSASLSIRSQGGTLSLSTVSLNAEANDAQKTGMSPAPINSNNQFDINVVATGAGTLDATVRVMGIVV